MIDGLDRIDRIHRAAASSQASIIEQVARLCAGAFADLCAIYLREVPGPPVAFVTRVPGEYDTLRTIPFDEQYAERARKAGVGRLLYQTLAVDGRTVGAVVLGAGIPASLEEATPEVCDAISSILSSAVAQSAQLAHHHRVSNRLQRAMLPETLIEIEGIRFDAAYSPASVEAEIGGDWYDVFDIGNATVGISVGDVTGHGLEAAVAMSEIRRAIRAAAVANESPAPLLDAVESMVSAQEIGVASAIVGIYDPRTFVLRYACAGHPPPIFVTSAGDAYPLPGGGVLLGLGIPAASAERTITLLPGSSCYFYTDGLIESKRDVLAGEERLLAVLETMAANHSQDARELHAQIIGEGPSVDDCATLVLHRLEADAAPAERYTFSAVPSSARLARTAISHYAERLGVDHEQAFNLLIAAGEAIANAIEHGDNDAGSTFSVEVSSENDELSIVVENSGHWRNTPAQGDRGRGIPIMRACTKDIEISSTYERTRLTLAFVSGI
jgi:anti-sigma regulatory factor (Ser/Thr protein kinase)